MKTKIGIRNIFEAFIIILIIVDLVLLIFITVYPDINPSLLNTIINFDLLVCAILFFDFINRMRESEDKGEFILKNWPDIIAMIPFDFLLLRMFRFVRLIRILKLFRFIRLFALFRRDTKYISNFFEQTHINVAIGMLLFTMFAGTITFYLLEHGTNPGVHTIWDSLWFTLTTMLTGNSNINPDTKYGEVIALLMITIGIAFVGILTASLASWLMSKSKKSEDDREKRLENIEISIGDIKSDIGELKELLKNNK